MRINCPCCGERSVDEFVYLGDANVTRPSAQELDNAEAFHAYGYLRRNLDGPTRELWFHAAGCHSWLVITRDTRTHEISKVEMARDVAQKRVPANDDGQEATQ